jgi:hypothetical protein
VLSEKSDRYQIWEGERGHLNKPKAERPSGAGKHSHNNNSMRETRKEDDKE